MDEEWPTIIQPLPYPTKFIITVFGDWVEEFIIPEEDKEIVLKQVYPFSPIPKLTEKKFDFYVDKVFLVKDFRVTWEMDINFLVGAYYDESGWSIVDWHKKESQVNEDDESPF